MVKLVEKRGVVWEGIIYWPLIGLFIFWVGPWVMFLAGEGSVWRGLSSVGLELSWFTRWLIGALVGYFIARLRLVHGSTGFAFLRGGTVHWKGNGILGFVRAPFGAEEFILNTAEIPVSIGTKSNPAKVKFASKQSGEVAGTIFVRVIVSDAEHVALIIKATGDPLGSVAAFASAAVTNVMNDMTWDNFNHDESFPMRHRTGMVETHSATMQEHLQHEMGMSQYDISRFGLELSRSDEPVIISQFFEAKGEALPPEEHAKQEAAANVIYGREFERFLRENLGIIPANLNAGQKLELVPEYMKFIGRWQGGMLLEARGGVGGRGNKGKK
ncbi:MAG: hypothetical protein HW383_617 [Candidatus Magasanikbacteria bacterium]|nr:hypothetical protein [Candidatus Magasanikbacteria bacterium]